MHCGVLLQCRYFPFVFEYFKEVVTYVGYGSFMMIRKIQDGYISLTLMKQQFITKQTSQHACRITKERN
jgi:hypothetical protein